MVLVALPSVILPGVGSDAQQMVALVALLPVRLPSPNTTPFTPAWSNSATPRRSTASALPCSFAILLTLSLMCAAKEDPTPVSRLFEAFAC